MTNQLQPTSTSNRIISLDILRGFALLGILIMNMTSFAMPGANYMNPMAGGLLEGTDKWAFYFSQLFANQKFMSLFSMLFGAGIILMTQRIEQKGKSAAGRHYFRNFWLLLIGLFHAYVIWHGDILVQYALCSIWLYLFRKKSAKTLFLLGAIFLSISMLSSIAGGASIPYMSAKEVADMCKDWLPTAEKISAEITAYQGNWWEHFPYRAKSAFALETFIFVIALGWQITGLMLIGMGLFKAKVLTAERSKSFYEKLMLIGFPVGLALGVYGLTQNYAHNWSCEYSFLLGSQWNFLGSVPMALGYIGLMMWLCKSNFLPILKKWLAPFGRMALTNYLMQSIIATFIFYGYGLGLFGTVGRAEQWIYILGIWIFQILFSKWWLGRFKFGPFEWFWRSLTYWKVQAIK